VTLRRFHPGKRYHYYVLASRQSGRAALRHATWRCTSTGSAPTLPAGQNVIMVALTRMKRLSVTSGSSSLARPAKVNRSESEITKVYIRRAWRATRNRTDSRTRTGTPITIMKFISICS